MKTALLGLFAFVTLFCCSGCGLIPGFDVGKTQEIAQKRQDELQTVADRIGQLEVAVTEAREAYEKAETEGDENAIVAAGKELMARLAALDLGKQDLDQAKTAADSAIQDFKDAKGAGGYMNVVLGSVVGILGAFGIGVPPAVGMIRRRNDALATTSTNVENTFGNTEEFDDVFLKKQREGLSRGAAGVLKKARGK